MMIPLLGICPYFTMFPISFPLSVLQGATTPGDIVLDPFCGRGTTNLAARVLGLESVGVDANPVAVAIAQAKLVSVSPHDIVEEAQAMISHTTFDAELPQGEFWELAYAPEVLHTLCRFRKALLEDCGTPARIALRAILLGALHGPIYKNVQGYFSNQCPRTYAPKPDYAIRFWKTHKLSPPKVDILGIIARRAQRYYSVSYPSTGSIRLGDSREQQALAPPQGKEAFTWVITSPPYWGMRTYITDQWLRYWFLGGPSTVDYSAQGQLSHSTSTSFARDLRSVWKNAAQVCAPKAKLVIRFGAISSRKVDPLTLLEESLADTGWVITKVQDAGTAPRGRRQADTFLRRDSKPVRELDVWAKKIA